MTIDKEKKYKKIFSKNLLYYMKFRNKTQTDIIVDLNINKSAISSWCTGTRLPRMNKIQMLAEYLNINVSDLIEDNCQDNNYFEFIAEDDAMFPLIDIGDVALIYKQNYVEKNATLLINMDNHNTIRKFVINKDKSCYNLTAMNAFYKNISINIDEIDKIKILGKVVKAENTSAFK